MKKMIAILLVMLAICFGVTFLWSCGGGGGGGDEAVDLDMDGYDSSVDCDDSASSCTDDCLSDVDGDGIIDCQDLCIDTDLDGYGVDNSLTIVGNGTDEVGSCTSDGATACIGSGPLCLDLDCDDDPATGYSVHPEATELCNYIDDDCDGQTDEGDPGGGVPCSTGISGICSAGTTDCQSGFLECVQNAYATTETCNGLDDDCDGESDEGFGTVDEDGDGYLGCADCNDIPGEGASIYPGATELCNGTDDDCDNETDEDFPDVDAVCTTSDFGACQGHGLYICNLAGDGIECDAVAGTASPEVCNNIDDDCDGNTDEGNPGGGVSCSTGGQGVCSAGTTDCDGGALVCVQNSYATAEICNGLDDDCDGQVDEPPNQICALTNNVQFTSCSSSQCEIVACQDGWFDCTGGYDDGCESSVSCP